METAKSNSTQGEAVALAHDSFTQFGGAERVFEAIHELYPSAPVYTLLVDKKLKAQYKFWEFRVTFLQYLYRFTPGLQYLLLLIPVAMYFLRPKARLLLSSSSSFIRNIHLPKNTIHINYCHTPARFLWMSEGYLDQELPSILTPFKPLVSFLVELLRRWDLASSKRVTYFIANSAEVQRRIKQFYNRESVVIHPFVNISFWRPTKPKSDYFLIAGRLHAHKNNELVIEIFNELQWPLHVIGTGRQEEFLRSIAKDNIQFFGKVSDEVLRDEYSGAKGFIYPQLEDFGMIPLEAAACGTASIGLAQGGSLETIIPGVTGELFAQPDKELIKQQILSWNETRYQQADLIQHATKFSKENFQAKMREFIAKVTF
jgi:glycosyltransferase involved in cell wall biosynthesis